MKREERREKYMSKNKITNCRPQEGKGNARKVRYLLIAICYLLVACDNPYMYRDLDELYWGRESNFFDITFDSAGGSEVPAQRLRKDSTVTRPQDPTNGTRDFIAWYKDINIYTAIWDFDVDTVTGNMTLYALWSEHVHTVTFDANGGHAEGYPYIITAEHNTTIEPPSVLPTKTGSGLYGWYREPDCLTEWDFNNDTVTGDMTLYARWVENTIIVTVSIEDIKSEDPLFDKFIISRTGAGGYNDTAIVRVNEALYYSGSIRWSIAGVGAHAGTAITGTGAEFTLDAKDARYNSLGNHVLSLEVRIDGTTYQTNIHFTIIE